MNILEITSVRQKKNDENKTGGQVERRERKKVISDQLTKYSQRQRLR
jgi:hypothetical protein